MFTRLACLGLSVIPVKERERVSGKVSSERFVNSCLANSPSVYCVRVTRTQPLICVGCSVHYWVPCAINKGGFFEIAFVVVVDTHLPRFEALAYVLPHFDELTHVVIPASSSVC